MMGVFVLFLLLLSSVQAAGSSGFPGLASEESMPFESLGRHVRVSSSANRPGPIE